MTMEAMTGQGGSKGVIEAEPVKEGKGILCPKCRYEMRVYHTKKMEGCVVRRRICDRCGHIQKTTEE